MSQLLTTSDLARHYQVHEETIRRWSKRPPVDFHFPPPITMNGRLRWRPADVERAEQPQAAGAKS
ncbi:MAG: hypothetical protein C0485_19330 [Pirellula sp.]|nr:hypothetical protein [Pirellula sp.]